MTRLLFWIAVPVVIFLALRWMAANSVFHPMKYPAGSWADGRRIGAQDVELSASDGVRLHAWWIRTDAPLATLYLHGNAGNITHRAYLAPLIVESGSSLLLLDYRGYGRSEGKPTEAGIYQDADAGYEFLRKQGFAPEQIIIHGESLGSAVAVELATRRRCAGVVLAAPFTSAAAVAATVLPGLGRFLIGGFDSLRRVGEVSDPLLILHGDRDEIIPYELGQELYEAARPPKWLWTIQGATHNDLILVSGPEYTARLRRFYSEAGISGRSKK